VRQRSCHGRSRSRPSAMASRIRRTAARRGQRDLQLRAPALVRLDEGAQRSVDPGPIARPLPLEPGERVGVEPQPDLLPHALWVMGSGVLVPVAGMSAQSGALKIAASSPWPNRTGPHRAHLLKFLDRVADDIAVSLHTALSEMKSHGSPRAIQTATTAIWSVRRDRQQASLGRALPDQVNRSWTSHRVVADEVI
jgi:hypothetical protein